MCVAWAVAEAAAPSQRILHRIRGEVGQPQQTVSSDEEQQQTEQQEAQDEEDLGGLMSSGLPAFSVAGPLADTTCFPLWWPQEPQ